MKQYSSVLAFLENLRTALWNWTLRLLPPAAPWWALWRGMKVASMHFFCIKPNCKIDKSYFVLPPRWLECGWQVLRDKCFSDPFVNLNYLLMETKPYKTYPFPYFIHYFFSTEIVYPQKFLELNWHLFCLTLRTIAAIKAK